jgi:2-oxoisovalerate dehydrogenase E1 component
MKIAIEIKKAFEIRLTEEKLLWAYARGLIRGTIHTCVGQEFNSVFLAKYLNNDFDWVLSNHRGHGHFLAFNGTPELLFREILGDIRGPSKGIGGSQHIRLGNFMTNGIQGGFAPISVGISESISDNDAKPICVLWVGDGTLGSGQLWESLNLSAILKVPLLVILEDNKIAQSTPSELTFAGDLQKRIEGFGLKYFRCAGSDLEELDVSAEAATSYVRGMKLPALLHIDSLRLNSHSKGDDNRDRESIEKLRFTDPVSRLLADSDFEDLYKSTRLEIDAAFELVRMQILFQEPQIELTNLQVTEIEVKVVPDQAKASHREQLYDNLSIALETFDDCKIFGEDILDFVGTFSKSYGGAFKVTGDLSTRFPGKLINMPISEAGFIGMGIGRALTGKETIIEVMFGDFLALGFDQILNQLSKIPKMYGIDQDIPIIIRTPMGGGFGYGATHSQSLEKHFLGIPNLLVIAPSGIQSNPNFIVNLLKIRKPILLLESKRKYSEKHPLNIGNNSRVVAQSIKEINLSFLVSKESGINDLLLVTYGGMTGYVLELQGELSEEFSISINVLVLEDLTRGIDAFGCNFKDYRRIVSIEEGIGSFGVGSEIAAVALEYGFKGQFSRIAGSGVIGSTKLSEDIAIPTKESIRKLLKEKIQEDHSN